MEFGEKLQLLRKQNNLTQEQLAAQLYVAAFLFLLLMGKVVLLIKGPARKK